MPHRSLIFAPPTNSRDASGRGLSSRHFLRLIEDSMDIGLWSADIHGDRLQGSLGLYRILGLDPSVELTFGLIAELMHPEDRRVHGRLLSLLRGGQAVHREFRIVRRNRTQRWVSSRAEVVLGPDDQPRYALGIMRDMIDKQQIEQSLVVEHDRFKALLDAIAAVVWINAPDGHAQDMPQWSELTGQSRSQMEGAGWLDALHPDDRERANSAWQTAVRTVSAYNEDYRLLCKDGVYRWFNARGAPVLNEDGSVREWVGVCLSIASQHRPRLSVGAPLDAVRPGDLEPSITPGQIRAARAMADMSADELARKAGVSVATIRRLEDERSTVQARPDTLLAVRQVLEGAGVAFSFGARPGIQPA